MAGAFVESSLEIYSPASLAIERYQGDPYDDWIHHQLKDSTRRTYARAASRFARFVGAPEKDGPTVAAHFLVSLNQFQAHKIMERWQTAMLSESPKGLKPRTINLMVHAMAAFVSECYANGLVTWKVQIDPIREDEVDIWRPGAEDIQKALVVCAGASERDIRNRTIVAMGFTVGTRRNEIHLLDWEDVNWRESKIALMRKGWTAKKPWSAPPLVMGYLRELWIVRGRPLEGPVFTAVDRPHYGHRLSGEGIRYNLDRICDEAGIQRFTPHSLRRGGADLVIELSNGNIQDLMEWGGWSGPSIALGYIKANSKRQSDMANGIADRLAK